ncbi:MAG: 50S ribosomal protein L17 [Candidatus Gastranaerophilales bacterium]|nr:50S ribosomal protein L17 [Clostridia bacterium]MBQ8886699.1 50S ribosomal protein L17 [Candidatus Gastranaerophilales bacterium]
MANDKLGRPSKERNSLLRGQVSSLLWNGSIETTLAKAKATARMAEKILTAAINSYQDTVSVVKEIKDASGKKIKTEVLNDGPKKLAARRKIMAYVYDIQEQRKPKESKEVFKARIEGINHPLIEKIFNVYAPKYAERAKELGQGGGYTRVTKLGMRRGDASEMAKVELI